VLAIDCKTKEVPRMPLDPNFLPTLNINDTSLNMPEWK